MNHAGYKATINCKSLHDDIQYEVGKEYSLEGMPLIHWQGFHYCNNPKNTLKYFSFNENFVLLEVQDLGDTVTDYYSSATNKIKILRKIDDIELQKLLNFKIKRTSFEFEVIGRFGFYIHKTFDKNNNLISDEYRYNYFNEMHKARYKYDDLNREILYQTNQGFRQIYSYDEDNNRKLERTWHYNYPERF